jgi:hypothetical protein
MAECLPRYRAVPPKSERLKIFSGGLDEDLLLLGRKEEE